MKKMIAALLLLLVSLPAYAQDFEQVVDQDAIFEKGYIQVVAESETGQSKYRATRAAEVIAQKKLLEILDGVQVSGATTLFETRKKSEVIATRVEGFLRGAIPCGEYYDKEEKYARVCMRVNLRGKGSLYKSLEDVIVNDPAALNVPQKPEFKPQKMIPKPTPVDGIVIDVREFDFRPALVNRILSDTGNVVFDPSKVLNQILVERGCGGYTNDMTKAKALLQTWGGENIVVLKASGVEAETDVMVGQTDADMIFTQNEVSGLLAQARVVFVLK